MKTAKYGEYAALLCIIVAVLAGLAAPWLVGTIATYIPLLLVILGLIVGFTTISEKETTAFLITTIVFIVAGNLGALFTPINTIVSPLGTMLNAIVQNIALFIAPAAMIVGFKAVYALAARK